MANYLKEERKRLGLTQEDIAKQVGVALRTYINWEHEVNPIPHDKVLKLKSLGFNMSYVLEIDNEMLVDRSTGDPPAGDALLNTLELIRKHTETAINLRKQELDKKD